MLQYVLYMGRVPPQLPPTHPVGEPLPKRTHSSTTGSLPFLPVLAGLILCACAEPPPETLTFTTQKQARVHTLDLTGALEAKRSHPIVTPRIPGIQPEVVFLVPEGSPVEKDQVVVAFDDSPVLVNYLAAKSALAVARAEERQKEAELQARRFDLEASLQAAETGREAARAKEQARAFLAPRLRKLEELRLNVSALKARKLRMQLESLDAIETEERRHTRLKVEQAERGLARVEQSMGDMVLRAPVDGIFLYARNPFSGGKVQQGDALYPGFPVGNIPDLSVLQVKLEVGEIPSRHLEKGQAVSVDISALGLADVPARVSLIAPVARPVTRGSRVKQREVIVELDTILADMIPGLSAECRIYIEETGPVVSVPLECIFDRDSARVVYVQNAGGFQPLPISVARQEENFAWVDSGLVGGERLALSEPEEIVK